MPIKLFSMNDEELEGVSGGRYLGPTFVYVLQPGDSLPVLAQRFGTTVRLLREINNIQSASAVKPGERILIPQR